MKEHRHEEFRSEFTDYRCVEPDCEFKGKPRQQGVCYATEPDVADYERIDKHISGLADELLRIRREHYPDDKEYIPWLEAHYECAMVNWAFSLDECIRLRREVALLRVKLEKLGH